MNIRFEQLDSHLAKSLAAVYLVASDEISLVNYSGTTIWQAAKERNFTERTIMVAETSFNWAQLTLELNNYSIFTEKRFIEIQCIEGKFSEAATKFIIEYCQSAPRDTVLVLKTAKLDATQQKAKWFQAISQVGIVLTIYPLNNVQFIHWIQNYAQKLAMSIDNEALTLLADYVEGNLVAAEQEIQKLYLIHGACKLNVQDITDALSVHYRYDIFALVDEALQKKGARVIRILNHLKDSAVEPILVLWALTKEIRTLAMMAYSLKQGENFSALCQTHRVWPQRKALVQNALQGRTDLFFHQLLQQACQIDELIKTTQSLMIWDRLLALSLSLAGSKISQ